MLAAPLTELHTLQASGMIHFIDDGFDQFTETFFIFDEAKGLRLDVVTPFGTPLLTMIVGRERLWLLDHRKRRAVIGPADAKTAEILLRLRIEPALLFEVVRGGLNQTESIWQPVPKLTEEPAELWYYQAGVWRVGIDPESSRPVRLSLDGMDKVLIKWAKLVTVEGFQVWREITVSLPNKKQTLLLKLSDIRVNQEIDSASWQPTIPENWKVDRIFDLQSGE